MDTTAATQLSGKGSVPWDDRGEVCERKTENEICDKSAEYILGDVRVAGLAQNRREWHFGTSEEGEVKKKHGRSVR